MEGNGISNNKSNTKEEINENLTNEENNSYRLSNILNGISYNEDKRHQKEISYLLESDDFKSGDNTTNSQIIDDINSSMINYKEMIKVCKEMSLILYKSNFNLKIKKGTFVIKYGKNIKKNYNELIERVKYMKRQMIELFEKFSRLVKFLEKAKEEILKNFKNESELEINIHLYTKKTHFLINIIKTLYILINLIKMNLKIMILSKIMIY